MPVVYAGKGGYTGHVDAAGLAEIGWTDDDIAYLQERVWWNEDADEAFEVPELDKECWQAYLNGELDGGLGGGSSDGPMVMSAIMPDVGTSSATDYRDIMFAPKFVFAVGELPPSFFFRRCVNLVAVPDFDLNGIIKLDGMYCSCTALRVVPDITITDNVVSFCDFFRGCSSMQVAPTINLPNISTGLSDQIVSSGMFFCCGSLIEIANIDVSRDLGYVNDDGFNINPSEFMIVSCPNLVTAKISGIHDFFELSCNYRLSTDSLRYIINHALEVEDKELILPKYNKLTDDDIAVATNKGWTVITAEYLGVGMAM